MVSRTWSDLNLRYGGKPCRVPGCNKVGRGVSSYCPEHIARKSVWGHPLGRYLQRPFYEPEILEVTKLIVKNRSHPAVSSAVGFLNEYIETSQRVASGELPADLYPVPYPEIIATISNHRDLNKTGVFDVEPLLCQLCGLHLYCDRNMGSTTVRDERHRVYIMGNAFVRPSETPQTKKGRGPVRRKVGQFLYEKLGSFFINVAKSVDRENQKQAGREQAYKMDLK